MVSQYRFEYQLLLLVREATRKQSKKEMSLQHGCIKERTPTYHNLPYPQTAIHYTILSLDLKECETPL